MAYSIKCRDSHARGYGMFKIGGKRGNMGELNRTRRSQGTAIVRVLRS